MVEHNHEIFYKDVYGAAMSNQLHALETQKEKPADLYANVPLMNFHGGCVRNIFDS